LRVVAAYSMIPTIFIIPIVLYLGLSDKFGGIVGFEYWAINIFYFIIWIWTLKILIQGIMRFNNFGFGKAILNISPILLIGIATYLIRYL
jgi:hypothetical protein